MKTKRKARTLFTSLNEIPQLSHRRLKSISCNEGRDLSTNDLVSAQGRYRATTPPIPQHISEHYERHLFRLNIPGPLSALALLQKSPTNGHLQHLALPRKLGTVSVLRPLHKSLYWMFINDTLPRLR